MKTLRQIVEQVLKEEHTDYSKIIAETDRLTQSIKIPGFEYKNQRHSKESVGDNIKADIKAARDALTNAGYSKTNHAKMMGGSESFDVYRHPQIPSHRMILHQRPRTRLGVRRVTISVKADHSM